MLIFRSQSIGLYCHYDKVCLIGVLYNDGIKREGERETEKDLQISTEINGLPVVLSKKKKTGIP